MPTTRRQMRTAGREMRMRLEGKVQQEEVETRPMGSVDMARLRATASWPDASEQRSKAQRERALRNNAHLMALYGRPDRPMAKLSDEDVHFYATASLSEINDRVREEA